MAILTVSPLLPPPEPNPIKPGFRQTPPPREVRRGAVIGSWYVSFTGEQPSLEDVEQFVQQKAQQEARANSFNSAISTFSFGGQTLQSLKEMSNAEFDAWWDTTIDTFPKALTVLKLLTRAAIRRLL